jgi:VWFA-related protein
MTHRRLARIALSIGNATVVAGLVASAAQERREAAEPPGKLRMQVVALDRDARPVMDLKQEELEVWIGPYRVPIERVTAITGDDRAVRVIALLLDDITQDPTWSPRVREGGRPFINRMAPGDRMAVATLNRPIAEFTDDPSQVLKRLDAHFGGYGLLPVGDVAQLMLERVAGLARGMAELPGRKAIVAIGGAWLFDTPIHPMAMGRDLRREWTDAMRALALADATVYVVDPGGVGTARTGTGNDGFARETGGHAFTNTNDLAVAADRILREIDNHYVIEIADPPVLRKSDLRELDLRTTRKDITVRARRWIPGSMKP